jgi:hypothetical protein
MENYLYNLITATFMLALFFIVSSFFLASCLGKLAQVQIENGHKRQLIDHLRLFTLNLGIALLAISSAWFLFFTSQQSNSKDVELALKSTTLKQRALLVQKMETTMRINAQTVSEIAFSKWFGELPSEITLDKENNPIVSSDSNASMVYFIESTNAIDILSKRLVFAKDFEDGSLPVSELSAEFVSAIVSGDFLIQFKIGQIKYNAIHYKEMESNLEPFRARLEEDFIELLKAADQNLTRYCALLSAFERNPEMKLGHEIDFFNSTVEYQNWENVKKQKLESTRYKDINCQTVLLHFGIND